MEFQDSAGNRLASPLRVGITVAGNDRTRHLRAAVEPAAEAANVVVSAGPRLSMTNLSRDGGVFAFDLVGTAASAARSDTGLQASHASGLSWQHPVSVVIPKGQTRTLPPAGLQPIAPANFTKLVSPGSYNFVTTCEATVTIHLLDQFGDPWGSVYDWATKQERFDNAVGPVPGGGYMVDMESASQVVNGSFEDIVGCLKFATRQGTPEDARKWEEGTLNLAGAMQMDGKWAWPLTTASPYYAGLHRVWIDGFELDEPPTRTVNMGSPNLLEVTDM